MSAECEIHGCDLVGHEFSEGGLRCPECDLQERINQLVRPGDQLQSSASRLAEWVLLNASGSDDYEVRMAALEAQSAVKEWTEIRRKF